ncbi:MAG: TldD/PmbA family protein, partial [Clostridia bacterium]|nr:TldD/PmbA family protein [Clostridia bacterium]
MIQDLLTNKKYLFASGANTELRAQRNMNRRAVLLNGALVGNVRTEQFGVSARVYENGVYGFSSTAEYTDETVKDVLKAASENAAFLAKHAGKGKGPHKAMAPDRIVTAYDLTDVEQRTYIEFAQALDNYIAGKYPDLVSRTVVVMGDSMEKLLCVSNGCDGHSILPRSYIYVMMTAMGADGKPVELYKVVGGGYGTFDQNYSKPEDCFAEIDGLYDRIQQKAKDGVYPDAGNKTVILGGILSGMLAHEAVGHTVEADLVIGGSVAGPCLHKRVGSDLVNLVDYAHTAFGKPTPLPIYVDDEGTAATDAVLIRDGILVGYMNSRES